MGGLRSKLPAIYWPFLAGALCLAGFPLTGGFFSKDAILTAVFEKGGLLYAGLLALGLVTALLTAFYTFRMLFIVFHGRASTSLRHQESDNDKRPLNKVEPVMTLTLIPLSLLGLFGGLLNLPAYCGSQALLTGLFATIPGFAAAGQVSLPAEIALQSVAAAASLLGLGLAWRRYSGVRRAQTLAREEACLPFTAFLQNGWYLDDLYRLFLIRPFDWLARFCWKRVDETAIDGTLDGLARLTMRAGDIPAGWSTGRVATSLIALAGGVAVLLVYVAWQVLV